jgi:thiol-disulfide isomerase/thioredoxin
MKKKTFLAVLMMCFGVVTLCLVNGAAADREPRVGMNIGNVSFSAPITAADATYLGLSGQRPFTLSEIGAPYVVVESMNTGCPHCMAQAPVLNELYRLVAADPTLRSKIKFVAAAQGNGQYAVQSWKRFKKVPFAVVPDSGSTLSTAMNFGPYPVTMLVDKGGTVLWVHVGEFHDAYGALQGIKNAIR